MFWYPKGMNGLKYLHALANGVTNTLNHNVQTILSGGRPRFSVILISLPQIESRVPRPRVPLQGRDAMLLRKPLLFQGECMLRGFAIVLAMLGTAAGQAIPVVDIVDIVPRNRIHEPTIVSTSGGRSGGNLDASPQESSLKMEILSAKAANDTSQPTMIFQVRLQNAGPENFTIPIDPNLADFEPEQAKDSYSYTSAHVFVLLEETKGILQGVSLYGSREITGSLKELHPGESIEIRARTPLKPVNPNTISQVSSQSSVRAGLVMQQNLVRQQGSNMHEDSKQIVPEITSSNVAILSAAGPGS